MDADLDTLCTAVYCTADDLLPSHPPNARRLVTLCVPQAIMGIPSDRRFLALAKRQLRALFPHRPGQSGDHRRRRWLAGTSAWRMGVFATAQPGILRIHCCSRAPPRWSAPAQQRDGQTLGA